MNRRNFLKNTGIALSATLLTPNVLKADNNFKWNKFKDKKPKIGQNVTIFEKTLNRDNELYMGKIQEFDKNNNINLLFNLNDEEIKTDNKEMNRYIQNFYEGNEIPKTKKLFNEPDVATITMTYSIKIQEDVKLFWTLLDELPNYIP